MNYRSLFIKGLKKNLAILVYKIKSSKFTKKVLNINSNRIFWFTGIKNKKMIRNLTRHLPNFITAINLACGFTSIVLIIEGNMIFACYFILLATIFDFLDGFFARLFDAYSDIGKQLDSLADIVSFGVAPALIMYYFLRISILGNHGSFSFASLTFFEGVILFSPVLLAIASAFRLAKFNIDPSQHDSFYGLPTPANAKFNIDPSQHDSFYGLPTPANAIFISSFVMNVLNHQKLYDQGIFTSKYFLLVLTIILSCLLVSRIPMFALKFHNFSFSKNKIRYVFIGISVILVIVLQLAALPFIIAIYILISLGCTIFKTRDKQIIND